MGPPAPHCASSSPPPPATRTSSRTAHRWAPGIKHLAALQPCMQPCAWKGCEPRVPCCTAWPPPGVACFCTHHAPRVPSAAVQLYDASTSPATKLGDPVVLNVTGGSGTDADPYVAGLGPFSQARVIAVAIQATGGAGGVATTLSQPSNAVVVGECRLGARCWHGSPHGRPRHSRLCVCSTDCHCCVQAELRPWKCCGSNRPRDPRRHPWQAAHQPGSRQQRRHRHNLHQQGVHSHQVHHHTG